MLCPRLQHRIQDRRTARAVATLQRTGIHLTSLRLGSEAGVLVACGGKGESTVYDVRTWSVSAVLQGKSSNRSVITIVIVFID